MRMDVTIDEIDACPVQIQGPKSLALMTDLVGAGIGDIPYYGIMEAEIAGCSVVISQSGFSGEKGYEIYLRDATLNAEKLWYAVLEAGKVHQLSVIAPGHQRRIQAGIMSWGPGHRPRNAAVPVQPGLPGAAPEEGRTTSARRRWSASASRSMPAESAVQVDAGGHDPGRQSRSTTTRPISGWCRMPPAATPIGYLTSPWHAPELGSNIALGWVPVALSAVGTAADRAPAGRVCHRTGPAGAGRRCARCRSGRRSTPAPASWPTPAARTPPSEVG